ncbi:thioesterase II family protein [Cupriavidus gilardii]|uniref:thioesterase II family protein n=1 Tax=Cupriavidus gilardii TaxID=82541 RepID=UPI001572F47D|nr:alpha/beta fold hydrolase [Cupriavidus gilardii]NSX02827.1 thioesterase [Cupriavidus gilardii]
MTAIGPVTLWCLPNAGAGAAAYAGWRRAAPAGLTIRPLELPGRGTRIGQPLCESFDALCDLLEQEVRQQRLLARSNHRHALFGHSMGALLAYELAHRWQMQGHPPCALLVSGCPAPRLRDPNRFTGPLDDAALMDHLRALDGTPPALLEHEEMMALTLPVLRADFRVCASYRHRERPLLRCPLHAFGGRGDRSVGGAVAGWGHETAAAFTLDWYDGGHFFLREHTASMLARIGTQLGVSAEPATMSADSAANTIVEAGTW